MTLELLRDAELYAPSPRGRADLLIGGERILWIGRDAPPIPHPYDVRETDLGGRRVIPGLVDGHVHLTGGGGEAGPHTRVPPQALSRFTLGGVTTAIGVLGTDDAIRTPAELVTVARGLLAEGLSAWCHTGGYHVPPATVTGNVRRDLVLVDRIIGVGEVAISDHRSSQPTLDELLRVAGDAHVGGLMSGKAGIVHLHLGDGPRGLDLIWRALDQSEIPARVFNPTHVNRRGRLFEEALAIVQRGCTIDLTAAPPTDADEVAAADGLIRYLDAGLPPERVTVSSDGGGCLPSFDRDGRVAGMDVGRLDAPAMVLRELLGRGQPLERVLPAFTRNPAALLRLEHKGRLVPGGDADLVVLDETGAPADVMALGRWHVRAGRPVVRGMFEGPA
jgi:beta-aspartyl-dipeptidase (metallo-type)